MIVQKMLKALYCSSNWPAFGHFSNHFIITVVLVIAICTTSVCAAEQQSLSMQLESAIETFDDKKVADLFEQGASAKSPLVDSGLTPLEKLLVCAGIHMSQRQTESAARIVSLLLGRGVNPNTHVNPEKKPIGTLPVAYLGRLAYQDKPVLPLVEVLVTSPRFDPAVKSPCNDTVRGYLELYDLVAQKSLRTYSSKHQGRVVLFWVQEAEEFSG